VDQKYATLALRLLTVVLLAVIAFELAGIRDGVREGNATLDAICLQGARLQGGQFCYAPAR
jgi:hypothetical protein